MGLGNVSHVKTKTTSLERHVQTNDFSTGLRRVAKDNIARRRRGLCSVTNDDGRTNMPELSEVLSTLKEMAPLSLAESWDNVGLLVEPAVRKPVGCVLLTNDLTEDVLDEAETVRADLIVSYHPPVFAPLKRIAMDSWKVSVARILLY